jgi:hypothetical protein
VVQDTLFDDENNPSHVEQANKTLTEELVRFNTLDGLFCYKLIEIVTR